MRTAKPYWVYVILCSDESLYTGIALDVAKRVAQHEAGKGAKYLRGRGPFQVVYTEKLPDKHSALRRELEIKKLPKKLKQQLLGQSTNNELL